MGENAYDCVVPGLEDLAERATCVRTSSGVSTTLPRRSRAETGSPRGEVACERATLTSTRPDGLLETSARWLTDIGGSTR